jgi:ribosome-associated protein
MSESAIALQVREIAILWDDIGITYARSGGPGGQNVNKVNSKVQLSWSPLRLPDGIRQRFLERFASRIQTDGEITIVSQEFRDQKRNLEAGIEKLREMLLSVLNPPKRRRPTKPTRGSIERRIREKKQQTERKERRRPHEGD